MENNDTYLSDWLGNKITDDQLKQLISNNDFLAFQKIKNSLENFTVEDASLAENYEVIQSKIQTIKYQKSKIIPLWKFASIAASFLIFIASYFYFTKENTFETTFGQKQNITLLDNSEVIINAKSKLVYSNFFKFNRCLTLSGEAFFKVQKGSNFTVITKQGKVEVLGTKFNVIADENNYFEVMCYEGKVRVTLGKNKVVLTHGESVRFNNNQMENWAEENVEKPLWINFESSFKNAPIQQVFEKIKNQYGVEIDFPKDMKETKFTGTITHKNLETALQSVCIPLHLNYQKTDSGKIIIQNE